ncbi:CoA pyrophosphatase [Shewanella salipaludis]|uniref:CoA pyrophosphatase n=1 Tax=Shewanella salipaludis TaxID=2723052 RepID=A0A972FZ10_9GAMM|nr:CoA pyrophosphatase [Shewanella salipaludis]NMH64169.1 CoA pyrophosphatase [Shewanella salipaludis]
MDQTEFRLRYSLHPLSPPLATPHGAGLRKAAVLVALADIEGELQLVLTRRPLHLRAHPGQISFPGGKVEAGDADDTATALREAEEEIGLHPANVEVLGQLPAHKTITGFEITPVVGLVRDAFEPRLDPGEVAEYFTLPLSFVIDPMNRHKRQFLRNGRYYTVVFIPFGTKFIWGATAAIIDILCRQLGVPTYQPQGRRQTNRFK